MTCDFKLDIGNFASLVDEEKWKSLLNWQNNLWVMISRPSCYLDTIVQR